MQSLSRLYSCDLVANYTIVSTCSLFKTQETRASSILFSTAGMLARDEVYTVIMPQVPYVRVLSVSGQWSWRVSSSNLRDALWRNTVLESTLNYRWNLNLARTGYLWAPTALCLQHETSEVIMNDEFNLLKPSVLFTYHQVLISIKYTLCSFVLSVSYGSQNRQLLLYTALTGWFL
jgi:hypothetical protein